MRQLRARCNFRALRRSALTVLMWNPAQARSLGLGAGCTPMGADCRPSRQSCEPFRWPGIRREAVEPQPQARDAHSRSTALASMAALDTGVLASSCCLPLFPSLAAARAAASAAFFLKLQPL